MIAWQDLGADLLRVELMDYLRGNLVAIAQDESLVTVAPKIDKLESEINWTSSAKAIDGKIRGFVYGPGTYTWLQGKKLKIHKARLTETQTHQRQNLGRFWLSSLIIFQF